VPIPGLVRRVAATLAGGWNDLPSVAARMAAPIRERAIQARAARRRRRR